MSRKSKSSPEREHYDVCHLYMKLVRTQSLRCRFWIHTRLLWTSLKTLSHPITVILLLFSLIRDNDAHTSLSRLFPNEICVVFLRPILSRWWLFHQRTSLWSQLVTLVTVCPVLFPVVDDVFIVNQPSGMHFTIRLVGPLFMRPEDGWNVSRKNNRSE